MRFFKSEEEHSDALEMHWYFSFTHRYSAMRLRKMKDSSIKMVFVCIKRNILKAWFSAFHLYGLVADLLKMRLKSIGCGVLKFRIGFSVPSTANLIRSTSIICSVWCVLCSRKIHCFAATSILYRWKTVSAWALWLSDQDNIRANTHHPMRCDSVLYCTTYTFDK